MGGRILVIDDIVTNRIVLKTKLSAAHFRVTISSSVDSAVEDATKQVPDLVFLSLNIGGARAQTICRNLKARPETNHIPILCFAQVPLDCPEIDLLDAGAGAVMINPVPDEVLLSKARAMNRTARKYKDIRLRENFVSEISVPRRMTKRAASVGCVSRHYASADKLRSGLASEFAGIVDVLEHGEILFSNPASSAYDVLLFGAERGDCSSTLNLLSELNATRAGQAHGIVCILPGAQRREIAKAYDCGADHVFDEFPDANVLSLQIQRLSDIRQRDEYLTVCIQDGLQMATTDSLTGVRNRRYAMSKLDKMSQVAQQTKSNFALLILDIDHFKSINDRYGHLAGDLVLQQIAETLRNTLDEPDLLARIGGEEFLVALPYCTENSALGIAEKLRRKIEALQFGEQSDAPFAVTISIGATLSHGGCLIEDIMRAADQALYSAKSKGRNAVSLSLMAA
ncbi:MAG: diguanylate cyclase [Pseudomonadota bacterium]